MTTTTATEAPALILEIHVCAARRSFKATFTGPDADAFALAFMQERGMTHAFSLWVCPGCARDGVCEGTDACAVDLFAAFPATMAHLYPTCEHGMDGRLCAGPGHYPMD